MDGNINITCNLSLSTVRKGLDCMVKEERFHVVVANNICQIIDKKLNTEIARLKINNRVSADISMALVKKIQKLYEKYYEQVDNSISSGW